MRVLKHILAVLAITAYMGAVSWVVSGLCRTPGGISRNHWKTKSLLHFVGHAVMEQKASAGIVLESDVGPVVDEWFLNHPERTEMTFYIEMWQKREDAWGSPLHFETDSESAGYKEIRLTSRGRDRKLNTNDDLSETISVNAEERQ